MYFCEIHPSHKDWVSEAGAPHFAWDLVIPPHCSFSKKKDEKRNYRNLSFFLPFCLNRKVVMGRSKTEQL